MDSLHTFPKDYPFNVRFGGNIYIRGGDRYEKIIIITTLTSYLIRRTCYILPVTLYLTSLPKLTTYLQKKLLYLPYKYTANNTYLSLTYLFRCDPDDPLAAKGYRPRINRNAVRKILGGAGQGILDSANQAEDDLSQKLAQTRVDDANNNPGPSTK